MPIQSATTPLPDRSTISTEQRNPSTMSLDTSNIPQCVALLNAENASVHLAVANAAPAITAFIEALEPRFRQGGRLIYIGAGTSGRLAVLDASECPPTFQTSPDRIVAIIAGGDRALRTSSESQEDDPCGAHTELNKLNLTQHDTLLGIAAGGTTPYVLGAIDFAKQHHALTALLTCSQPSQPVNADHVLFIDTGPEPITGSTRMKAGTATKLVLNTISTTLMVRQGKIYQNLMVDLRASNNKLRDRALRILVELTQLPRHDAALLLEQANDDLKTAIVMHKHSCSQALASSTLAANSHILRDALQNPD